MSCFAPLLCAVWRKCAGYYHGVGLEYVALVQVVEGYEVVKAAEACGELSGPYSAHRLSQVLSGKEDAAEHGSGRDA